MKLYMKKVEAAFFMDVQNVEYVQSETYFCPNSIKIEVLKVTRKEKPPNLNLAEPSELRVNENLKNQVLVDIQPIIELS